MAMPIEHFPEPPENPILSCIWCDAGLYRGDDCEEYQGNVFCSMECVYESVKEEVVTKTTEGVEEEPWI